MLVGVKTLEPQSPHPVRATLRMRITSVLFWTYLVLSSPILWSFAVLLFLATAPFDRQRRWLHLYTCAWAYHYLKLPPLWSTRIEGIERIPVGQACVLVANHQSMGDILLLFGLFRHFKWVSKRVMFRVPFIGWNMRMNNYVSLVRGDAVSIERMLDACRAHLRQGSPVMLFPEGTRSEDGQIKAFKRGAFTLATELGLPLVPIVVDGTRDILPKHGFLLRQDRRQRMRVRVLAPVPVAIGDDARELGERVREQMVEELARMRGEVVP